MPKKIDTNIIKQTISSRIIYEINKSINNDILIL
jgi:hypothetical protein